MVPRYYIYNASLYESEDAYFKVMGYRLIKADDNDPGTLESSDDYVNRMQGSFTLYHTFRVCQDSFASGGGGRP